MELRDVIYNRRAVRNFMDVPVSRASIVSLIDAAIQAPSAMNEQPWFFTVVRNAGLLSNIAAAAKQYALQMSANNHHATRLHDVLVQQDYHVFYHAPALVIISARSGVWAVEDATLAAQNLMLAAYNTGIGSCWIGFAQAWLNTPEGRSAISLPSEYIPVAPIILGYPAMSISPVSRQPARVAWLD